MLISYSIVQRGVPVFLKNKVKPDIKEHGMAPKKASKVMPEVHLHFWC